MKSNQHDICNALNSPCFNSKCTVHKERKLKKKRIEILESKLEERWDFICSSIGFDEKGFEIQDAIKEFVSWKLELEELKK